MQYEKSGKESLRLYEYNKSNIAKVKIFNDIPDNRVELINQTIDYACKNSKFYKHKNIIKIENLEDMKRLPFTTKEDIKDNSPYGFLAKELYNVVRYGESTGTDGKFSSGYVTDSEWIENCATLFLGFSQIISSEDIFMITVPYELSFVAADFDRVAEIIGATTIGIGILRTKAEWYRTINMMCKLKVTVFACAPTRIIRLAYLAKEKGYDLKKDFNLKKVICVGELLTPMKKKIIEDLWGCEVYVTYGMTEATSVASPCENNKLHLCESRYYFEVIDPITCECVEDGQIGELVLTSLNNFAMPLIRFKTGDLVRIDNSEDTCFLNFRKIKHYGRLSDYICIENKRIYYFDMENLLLSIDGIEPFFVFKSVNHEIELYVRTKNIHDFSKKKEEIKMAFKNMYELELSINELILEEFFTEFDSRSKPGNIFFERIKNENINNSK